MSVRIFGKSDGSDYEAAVHLKEVIEPALGAGDEVFIVCNPIVYGQAVQEIDLLILGTFGRGIDVTNHLKDRKTNVRLVNLCLTVEVKEHSRDRLFFDGQRVIVQYKTRNGLSEKDVTDQAWNQQISLRKYLERHGIKPPFVSSAIWLRNYHGTVPKQVDNVLAGSPSFTDLVQLISRVRNPKTDSDGRSEFISFSANDSIRSVVEMVEQFTHKLRPGGIDRRRIEQISKRLIGSQKYAENLGDQLLLFRGRGGSGKTMHLLRIAKDLVDDGSRVLFLTFNQALVSDIRRLMMIIGISDQITEPSFCVKTVHQYMGELLRDWCDFDWVLQQPNPFPKYSSSKAELLAMFEGETTESIHGTENARRNGELYGWDYVLVDEGQDWPSDERDILRKVFGFNRLIVADGVDQLIRNQRRCDWLESISQSSRQVVPLRRSMRMKSQLVLFANTLAAAAGIDWEIEPIEEMSGGRITVIVGPYRKSDHENAINEMVKEGNEPVDVLICCPPDYSKTQERSIVEILQDSWGADIWDGTSKENRGTYPERLTQQRCVKYESCRGLEGWTVVCARLDQWFEFKKRHVEEDGMRQMFDTDESVARKYALRWLMIPMTRAIDHLVLHVQEQGDLHELLMKVREMHPDMIDWFESSSSS